MARELRTITETLARVMANANGDKDRPDVHDVEGNTLVAGMALAGEASTFSVGTPFGSSVRVIVVWADGMFHG